MTNGLSSYIVNIEDHTQLGNQVVDLWVQQGNPREVYEKRFQWFYMKNPLPKVTMYTLRKNEESLLLGTKTIMSREWQYKGSVANIAVFGDFFVDEKHRSLGPALKLLKAAIETSRVKQDLLYGFPNQKAEPVFKKAGFKNTGHLIRYSRVILTSDLFEQHSKLNKVAFISPLVDFVLGAYLKLACAITTNYTLREEMSADSRFDDLWEAAKDKYTAIGQRDARYINWRALAFPKKDMKLVSFSRPNTEDLQAYVVYCTDRKGHFWVDDILCKNGVSQLKSVMMKFFSYAQENGAKTVSFCFSGGEETIKILRSLAMQPRESRPIYGISGNNDKYQLEDFVKNAYLTNLDEDQ